ncbi:hypothetical protein [Microbulbifer sp. ARAS458-1]|uniref:hypothetical protein n=1 Tax=Microbulbifer sp. ARAS458-1 TaxID=3140242 RepID=UPI003878371C
MAENQNPKLGTVTCPAGGVADVYQTRKRGRHFYTRCACCGLLQGTGPKRQQEIWDTAEFLQGVTVHKPANVDDSAKGEPIERSQGQDSQGQDSQGSDETGGKTAIGAAVSGDFDPKIDAAADGEEQEKEAPAGGVRKGLAAVGVTLLAVGAGLWMS